MRVLLLSMPDSFEHTPALAIRMPNGALASLAGNVDPHHQVSIADLVLVQTSVRRTIERLIRDLQPDARRPVGHDVPAQHRATDHLAGARPRSWRAHRGRWLRPEPGAAGVDPAGPGHRLHRPRRGGTDVPRSPARDRRAHAAVVGRRTLVPGRRSLPPQSSATRRIDRGRRRDAAEPRGARPLGLHDARPPGGRGRDVARLHLRLQLLLDHRDARPQLSPLPDSRR